MMQARQNLKAHAIYVHVPFCKQKCLYCDFRSQACRDVALMECYAEQVCREIQKRGETAVEQATIYFGGGTPSLLSLGAVQKIVVALKEYGLWQSPAEVTIECNPGTVDGEKLQCYRELGFDRISFGVQSFSDAELQALGRIHNMEEALAAIKMAKDAGFQRINADLMYGIPLQTLESLEQSINQLVALDLEHISVYGLILEEGTPLAKLVEQGRVQVADEDLQGEMYDLVMQYLAQNGYERYEISNFAKAGGCSIHNLVYWNYLPYLGFGTAATGFDGYQRRTGESNLEGYLHNPLQCSYEKLTEKNIYSEFMFMNLRKTEGVELKKFAERYGTDIVSQTLAVMQPFIDKGLAKYDEKTTNLRLTERGMAVSNVIFRELV